MGIGKMARTMAPEGVGKMSKQRYGIGKMQVEMSSDERKAGMKASDDIEKALASKK